MTLFSASEVDKKVSIKVREFRVRAGYSQREVAERLGIVTQQISKYECDGDRITVGRLYLMAVMFGVRVQDFFSGIKP